jgi:septal ring factor EnvC (AmiA/AmiB activator)
MPDPTLVVLELVSEVAELRRQLAEAQEHCVEMAIDAGYLNEEIRSLRRELTAARREKDALQATLGRFGRGRAAA